MILKKALELRRSIDRYRRNMNELATNKGISHPEVIRMSQKLDEEIIILQKILYKKELSQGFRSHFGNL
jgi:DNA-binding Lrp family transcriptional regulator